MAQENKIKKVESLVEAFKEKDLVFFNYQGINVTDFTEIRSKARENGTVIKVTKNTFLKLVLEKLDIKADDSLFAGMNAIAVIDGDFSASAKVLLDAQNADKIALVSGYTDGEYVDKDYVVKLASIPSQEILYSMLVGCLSGPVSNLVYTLDAIKEQKQQPESE